MSGAGYFPDWGSFVFRSAVEFLKGKTPLPKAEYEALDEEARALAFTVAGYTEAEVLQEFLGSITEAVEQGKTMREFREGMDAWLEGNGYGGLTPDRAELIFRTNVQTAYNAGHYKSMMEAARLRPYWMYVTAADGRVRDTHAALHGAVYRADDPFWDVWYPPNGYKCRCHVRSYSERQVRERGLQVAKGVPRDVDLETGEIRMLRPDKGFSGNPAKQRWQPDTSKLSREVRAAYEGRRPG